MRVQLVPLDGGEAIEITKDLVLIGRKEDCDLHLDHKSVSKLHCIVVKTDGLLLLRDLGSTNGTRVNGQRVRRAALLPNDHLHIASLCYRVDIRADRPAPPNPEEHTQHLDAREVSNLLKKVGSGRDAGDDDDSLPDVHLPPIQTNALPDVYPDGTDQSDR